MKGASVVDVAVLMTAHNRRTLTAASVSRLMQISAAMKSIKLTIFLVDDGSTDGTKETITKDFPQVILIEGDGSLFWAGGMRLAFDRSLALGEPDAYLLVNDDVGLDIDAVVKFLGYWHQHRDSPMILVGKTTDGLKKRVTYAGFSEGSRVSLFDFSPVLAEGSQPERCDTFNANFVIVPGKFFRSVGGLDAAYTHAIADLDLGLTARRAAIPSYVWPEPIGTCERGVPRAQLLRRLPRRKRAVMLFVHPYGLSPDMHFAWKHRPRLLFPVYAIHGLLKRVVQLVPARRSQTFRGGSCS